MEKHRILLVEDDADTAATIELLLGECGCSVCAVVDNGGDAVAWTAKHRPDLVVMDIVLPGAMDGVAAAQVIRQQSDIPVVLVTGHCDESLVERLKLAAPMGFLTKPVARAELSVAVESAIFRDRADKELARRALSLVEANLRAATLTTVLEQLRAADSALQASGDFNAFYRTIVSHLVEATKAKRGAFGIFDAHGRVTAFIAAGPMGSSKLETEALPEGKGVLSAIYQGRRLMRTNDIARHRVHQGFPAGHPTMTSMVGIPLIDRERCLGVIYLADRNGGAPFTGWDETLLMIYAAEAVHVLQRAALLEETRQRGCELARRNEELEEANRRLGEAQAQLLQSEKLASIGQLAAGVAHEINNPVGYVGSNIESLGGYVNDLLRIIAVYEAWAENPADGSRRAELDAALRAADLHFIRRDVEQLLSETLEGVARVRKIVQDLKEFSHVDEGEWETADLHKGIESTLNVVRNEIKYKAELVREFGEIPLVECLPSQLNQVFMNLLVNAAQAIDSKGTITVRTAWDKAADEVTVDVRDSGCGIPPEMLKKIFDPFFTTKPVGQGTGLGLSVSYGIVTKHGGTIEVESQVSKGTCFRVRLPVKRNVAKLVESVGAEDKERTVETA